MGEHPRLFNEIAKASFPIIGTFNAQNLANIANAYSRMNIKNQKHLFDAIATTATPIIKTFSLKELITLANAYETMNIDNPKLFNIITTTTPSNLSNSKESMNSLE